MELAPYCYTDTPTGFADLVELLTGLGYSFQRLPSLAPIPTNAALLEREIIPLNGSINILAIPMAIGTSRSGEQPTVEG